MFVGLGTLLPVKIATTIGSQGSLINVVLKRTKEDKGLDKIEAKELPIPIKGDKIKRFKTPKQNKLPSVAPITKIPEVTAPKINATKKSTSKLTY